MLIQLKLRTFKHSCSVSYCAEVNLYSVSILFRFIKLDTEKKKKFLSRSTAELQFVCSVFNFVKNIQHTPQMKKDSIIGDPFSLSRLACFIYRMIPNENGFCLR